MPFYSFFRKNIDDEHLHHNEIYAKFGKNQTVKFRSSGVRGYIRMADNSSHRQFVAWTFRRTNISSSHLNISYGTTGSGTFVPGIFVTRNFRPLKYPFRTYSFLNQKPSFSPFFPKHIPLQKPQLPFFNISTSLFSL